MDKEIKLLSHSWSHVIKVFEAQREKACASYVASAFLKDYHKILFPEVILSTKFSKEWFLVSQDYVIKVSQSLNWN